MTPTAKQLTQEYAAKKHSSRIYNARVCSTELKQECEKDYISGYTRCSESVKPVLAEAIEALNKSLKAAEVYLKEEKSPALRTMINLHRYEIESILEKLKALEL